jgi:hypothetical protein
MRCVKILDFGPGRGDQLRALLSIEQAAPDKAQSMIGRRQILVFALVGGFTSTADASGAQDVRGFLIAAAASASERPFHSLIDVCLKKPSLRVVHHSMRHGYTAFVCPVGVEIRIDSPPGLY